MPAPPADAADVETLWSCSDLYGNIKLLKFMDYLGTVKAANQNVRIILNNNWNRCKAAGGPIIPSIQKCNTMEPAVGGGFKATLHTQNAFCVNDGCELRLSANGENKKDALTTSAGKRLHFCCSPTQARSYFRTNSGKFLATPSTTLP